MKIYAQSEVPAKMPYLHLAYVAATTNSASNYIIGLMVIVTTLLVACYRYERRRLGIGGVFLSAVFVLVGVAIFYTQRPSGFANPEMMSGYRAQVIRMQIEHLKKEGKKVPSTASAILRGSNADEDTARDAWGRDFRISKHTEGSETHYRIISAGKDGKFGSSDDITWPRTGEQ